jgi:hypothetical protein
MMGINFAKNNNDKTFSTRLWSNDVFTTFTDNNTNCTKTLKSNNSKLIFENFPIIRKRFNND